MIPYQYEIWDQSTIRNPFIVPPGTFKFQNDDIGWEDVMISGILFDPVYHPSARFIGLSGTSGESIGVCRKMEL